MDRSYLKELIEREKEYCDKQVVGSEEYVNSMLRLMGLEKQLSSSELEVVKYEDEKKSKKMGNIIEWTKIGANVALPLIGYVVIVAAEKEISFTGALRDVTKSFLPKKM